MSGIYGVEASMSNILFLQYDAAMDRDPIDHLAEQWRHELDDLDTAAMVTVARLNRTRALTMGEVERALTAAGSSLADFDVLSTLRRQGPPHQMKPSSIARSIMLSASGMTSRIDHLERAGLVQRVTDPTNRRIAPVALTPAGVAEAERLVRALVATEEELLSCLTPKERRTLDTVLTKLAAGIEQQSRQSPPP
jgi:DNA-binding MarR family transcriptional regulator